MSKEIMAVKKQVRLENWAAEVESCILPCLILSYKGLFGGYITAVFFLCSFIIDYISNIFMVMNINRQFSCNDCDKICKKERQYEGNAKFIKQNFDISDNKRTYRY